MEVKKETGYFESFDGTKIYYETRGEGPPLLLAYGIACQMNHWIHQIEYFSKKYRVITFDYRGHHKSETPLDDSELSIETLAKDVSLLCEHLNVQKLPAFGHSMGVQVLIRAARLFPQLFSHLVLINGFASNPFDEWMTPDQIAVILDKIKEVSEKNSRVTQKIWEASILNPLSIPIMSAVGGFNLSVTQKKNIEIYLRGVAAVNFQTFIILFKDMIEYDGRLDLPLISCPTLVINGEKDGVTPERMQKQMVDLLPKGQFLKIPYGSHCSQLDFPDVVNLQSENFLHTNS